MDSLLGSAAASYSSLPEQPLSFGEYDSSLLVFDDLADLAGYDLAQEACSNTEDEMDLDSQSSESAALINGGNSFFSRSSSPSPCADQQDPLPVDSWLAGPVATSAESDLFDLALVNNGVVVNAPAEVPEVAPVTLRVKRSASDAGLENPSTKRIKTEALKSASNGGLSALPSLPQVALANSQLVAAYQQLLLIQLQKVQALLASPGSTTQVVVPQPQHGGLRSPSLSSSSSSTPSSPIKCEPLSPVIHNHSHPLSPEPCNFDVVSPGEPSCLGAVVPPPEPRRPFQRDRRVRPKVVPEKGGVQCEGINRKKNTRCKNAALMEYMGPRPIYCAEHIHLDPTCLYTKCHSRYQTTPHDGKNCREVVLKEFGFCHKHFQQYLEPFSDSLAKAIDCQQRVEECLSKLTSEAQTAKKIDPDLFQRKHKLIPKFVQMKTTVDNLVASLIASSGSPPTF